MKFFAYTVLKRKQSQIWWGEIFMEISSEFYYFCRLSMNVTCLRRENELWSVIKVMNTSIKESQTFRFSSGFFLCSLAMFWFLHTMKQGSWKLFFGVCWIIFLKVFLTNQLAGQMEVLTVTILGRFKGSLVSLTTSRSKKCFRIKVDCEVLLCNGMGIVRELHHVRKFWKFEFIDFYYKWCAGKFS